MKVKRVDINGNLYDIEAFISPIPVGTVLPFAGNTVPEGFLFTEGQEVLRNAYPNLFAAIGTTYGAGDGSTTFNLPNLVNRFIEGTKDEVGKTVEAGLPNITAGFTAYTYLNGSPSGKMRSKISNTNQVETGGGNDRTFVEFSLDASRDSNVYGKSDTVQPPAIKMSYIIKY